MTERRRRAGNQSESGAAAEPSRTWVADNVRHIDVRGLEPPTPMVLILKEIDSGAAGGQLIVHHDREPIFLYPELAARGWTHTIVKGEEGEVRLHLRRDD